MVVLCELRGGGGKGKKLVMGNDGVNESKVLEEFKGRFSSGNYSLLLA